MALFGNSATITEIHREIGIINDYIRKMESNINTNNGIHRHNVEVFTSYLVTMKSHKEKVEVLVNSLSDRELRNLTICWIDGKYFPLFMWNDLFKMVMTDINNEILKFERYATF